MAAKSGFLAAVGEIAELQGWDESELLELALRYMTDRLQEEKFLLYLREIRDQEIEDSYADN
jgi:hypothetical protein